jgi:hypothetical protein
MSIYAILVLRLALAAVLGGQAVHLLLSGPPLPLLALAASETVAAALLAVPVTTRAGAWALAAVLVWAAALHVATGHAPPASFAVYLPALWVVAGRTAGPRRAGGS